MKVQEIIDRLTVLGLDDGEAAVYVHLSMMGPSKASDIAAALKLHRTEAYRTLQNLVQRGFASATLGRPSKFVAAPPEKLFNDILAAHEARSESIKRAQGEIAGALTSLRGEPTEAQARNTFKVLQGRREIYSILERMVRDARTSVKSVSTHPGALTMADMAGIWDVAVERAREGLTLDAILQTTPATRGRLSSMIGVPNIQLRHLDSDHIMRFVVVDERELLVWVVNDPSTRLSSEQDVAIWSDATDFVAQESVHFDALWQLAQDLRTMMVAEGLDADSPGVPR
ncbi:MAG TPA: helix-turn-helix domain-containing protein [Candidatus Thermoplasmatota archaeon]|nr:helix-turn-helix domain-containing protein [Candidatus Thermoplasmatota archaeon]